MPGCGAAAKRQLVASPDGGGDEARDMDERMAVVPAGLDHAGRAVGPSPSRAATAAPELPQPTTT